MSGVRRGRGNGPARVTAITGVRGWSERGLVVPAGAGPRVAGGALAASGGVLAGALAGPGDPGCAGLHRFVPGRAANPAIHPAIEPLVNQRQRPARHPPPRRTLDNLLGGGVHDPDQQAGGQLGIGDPQTGDGRAQSRLLLLVQVGQPSAALGGQIGSRQGMQRAVRPIGGQIDRGAHVSVDLLPPALLSGKSHPAANRSTRRRRRSQLKVAWVVVTVSARGGYPGVS